MFPVKKKWDEAKGKWKKAPGTNGESWLTYRATPEQLERAANIGVTIPPGVLVIDVDTYKGTTTAAIDKALGVGLAWDEALLQETVSGGRHYVFALPEGASVRQGNDLLGVQGFDTRVPGKGWICTGDGYTQATFLPAQDALTEWPWPMLPDAAIARLADGWDGYGDDEEDEAGALLREVSAQPIEGIGVLEIVETLRKLPDGVVERYSSWLEVGMAIHHQTEGSRGGFRAWVSWSKKASTYDLDECKTKWVSFGKRRISNPITFASVIRMAGGSTAPNKAADKSQLDRFEEEIAEAEESREVYFELRDKIKSIPAQRMGEDVRSMLAQMMAERFGGVTGLSATKIGKAIAPEKRSAPVTVENVPEWVTDWLFVESTCEFYHKYLHYGIKTEAFNAKFNREPDVVAAERNASALALTSYGMPTVVDMMYQPGGELMFSVDGKLMVNTYRHQGIEPDEVISEEGQAAIDRFCDHIRKLTKDETEQQLLFDWMAWIAQNPSKRINWMLVIQGAEGCGKTYLSEVLRLIHGDNVKKLDTTAISGRFTGWAHGAILNTIEELRVHGSDKYAIVDRLKPLITNDKIQIEEKGRDHRTVINHASYLALTNHKDAIPVQESSRRFAVVFSDIQRKEDFTRIFGDDEGRKAHFDRLFADMRDHAGALVRYLLDYEISGSFDHLGRAPDTVSRLAIIDATESPEKNELEDAIEKHECPVINKQVLDVTELNRLAMADGIELPVKRQLSAILHDMGYQKIPGGRIKISTTNRYHYIWCKGQDGVIEQVRRYHEENRAKF